MSHTSFAWPKFVFPSHGSFVTSLPPPRPSRARFEPTHNTPRRSLAAAISAVRFARREEEEGGRREGRREEHEERWPAAEAETVRRRRITGGCRQGGGTPGVHGSLQNVIPHLQDSSLHPYDPTLRKVLYGPYTRYKRTAEIHTHRKTAPRTLRVLRMVK